MLRWPNRIAPEMNVTTCVSSLDIAPTILQLCGQPVPDSLPGIDLTNAESLADRKAVRGEIFEHDVVDVANPSSSLRYRWLLRPPYKLIEPAARLTDERSELYDVFADPQELHNLAGVDGERLRALQTELEAD